MLRLDKVRTALLLGATTIAIVLPAFGQAASPFVAAQPSVQTATQPVRSYVKVDGVAGESLDSAHPAWIEITSFQWGAAAASSAARIASREARRAVSSLTINKATDKASPPLQKATAEGTHFKTVVLDLVSRSKGEYYQVTMSDVLVSSFRLNSSGDRISESVTFNFAKLDAKYGKVDAQGTRGPLQAVPAGWDIKLAVPN